MTTTRGVRRVTITMSMFTIRMVVLCRISQIEEVHGRDSYRASSAGLSSQSAAAHGAACPRRCNPGTSSQIHP